MLGLQFQNRLPVLLGVGHYLGILVVDDVLELPEPDPQLGQFLALVVAEVGVDLLLAAGLVE